MIKCENSCGAFDKRMGREINYPNQMHVFVCPNCYEPGDHVPLWALIEVTDENEAEVRSRMISLANNSGLAHNKA